MADELRDGEGSLAGERRAARPTAALQHLWVGPGRQIAGCWIWIGIGAVGLLDLLVGRLNRRIVFVLQQLRINHLPQTSCKLLRTRPVHVLDEQVARSHPQ
ncbi:MAG: hypothetical protein ACK559_36085, partial [bacterium]